MQKTVGLMELQQQFETIFNEVADQNIPYILTRGSQPQVVLIPYNTFRRFQAMQEKEIETLGNWFEPAESNDLIQAAHSSLDFWDNPFDDEDWNNA